MNYWHAVHLVIGCTLLGCALSFTFIAPDIFGLLATVSVGAAMTVAYVVADRRLDGEAERAAFVRGSALYVLPFAVALYGWSLTA